MAKSKKKKIPYDLDALKANVERCDNNIEMFEQKIQDREKEKKPLLDTIQGIATGRFNGNIDMAPINRSLSIIEGNIELIREAIRREREQQEELRFYIREIERENRKKDD